MPIPGYVPQGNETDPAKLARAIRNLFENARGSDHASFHAHKNTTDQTGITSATNVKVTAATETFDYGGYYDATNSKWTPPAGRVAIKATVRFTANVVDAALYHLVLYKNNAAYKVGCIQHAGGTGNIGASLAVDDDANGTDYYELYAFGGGAGDKTISGAIADTYFSGSMI